MAARVRGKVGAAFLIFSFVLSAGAQERSWTVRPEWVRAHEEFLASDLLRGRGSATPDEGIAAQYVGTRFESYGLKPVDGKYVQKIELQQPKLDGHSVLRLGNSGEMQEDRDYALVWSSGESLSGALQKIPAANLSSAQAQSGAVVLVTGKVEMRPLLAAVSRLSRQGARAVLADCPPFLEYYEAQGDETAVPVTFAGTPPTEQERSTVLLLKQDATSQLAALADGTPIALTVHATPETRYTYNAIGVLPGRDAQAKPVLLTAHLDHLGVGKPVNGDAIYNGANDDASGTTAVMELAHALAAGSQPRRTVYFVCFGSEERGQFGDRYFRDHPPVPLDRFDANIEFEMMAVQDPGLPKGTMFMTGWERSNLGPTLKAHGAHIGPDPYPKEHYFERSDNYTLAKAGVVAQTIGGANMDNYHKPSDDLAHVDLALLRDMIQSLVAPLRWLVNADFVPAWKPGGKP